MTSFEWDENKQKINLIKHGIDFTDAIKIFDDPFYIEATSIKNVEKRFQAIGMINNFIILVIYTYRNKKRRIISARRASKNERKKYFQTEQNLSGEN